MTENDRRGLFLAFRRFINIVNGQKIYEKAGLALIDRALGAGLTVDELFNKENYGRACEVSPGASAETYVQLMADMDIEVRPLTDEPMWHDAQSGFAVIAECAHEFFLAVTGRGGRWSIPSALTNLAKAVKDNSLQGVLSEELILRLKGENDSYTYFNFTESLARDFNNTLGVDNGPTAEQAERAEMMASLAGGEDAGDEVELTAEEVREMQKRSAAREALIDPDGDDEPDGPAGAGEGQAAYGGVPDIDTYPDWGDDEMLDMEDEPTDEQTHFASFMVRDSPQDTKKAAIAAMINGSLNMTEVQQVARLVDGGEDLSIIDIVQRLADGDLSPAEKDDAVLRSLHVTINAHLLDSFVECVSLQGVQMTAASAEAFDILRVSWDLRDASVRKIHKLRQLVYTYGADDEDLREAVADLERIYTE